MTELMDKINKGEQYLELRAQAHHLLAQINPNFFQSHLQEMIVHLEKALGQWVAFESNYVGGLKEELNKKESLLGVFTQRHREGMLWEKMEEKHLLMLEVLIEDLEKKISEFLEVQDWLVNENMALIKKLSRPLMNRERKK